MKRHEYRVGIICALPKELAAVIAMLTESHIPLPQRAKDTNAYTLGRIGPHNVVITCLPGRTGTTSAAGVTIQLKASFPSIRFGLLVGIAGGIPSETHDIRLGDVVVSYPNGTSGGIIQYDFGKTERGGVFTRCGQVNRPPDELLSAVNSLFAKQLLREGDGLAEQLSATAIKFPKMNSWWLYPGSQHDRLFQAQYEHSQSHGDCTECDPSQLIQREVRQSEGPVIHFGTIASGNRVIKHGAERDRIGCDLRALCFDMEAAGVVDSLPCLVVRGISDYADSHKNDKWQQYAAGVAAVYARELLQILPSEEPEYADEAEGAMTHRVTKHAKSQTVNDSLVAREAWSMKLSLEEPQSWQRLRSRVSDYDHEKFHRRMSLTRLAHTTSWFLNHATFKDWVTRVGPSSLWCSGPRSGKTIISASVIDYLKQMPIEHSCTVFLFYLEASYSQTLSALYLIQSLIKQILDRMERNGISCPSAISSKVLYFFNPTGPQPDWEDIVDIFSDFFRFSQKAFYVIDGLDQMEEQEVLRIVKLFRELLKNATSQKIFIASREQLGLNVKLDLDLRIHVSLAASEEDVRYYIQSQVAHKMEMERELTKSKEVREKIVRDLSEGARGMFLWARLQIEALWRDCTSDKEILQALVSLPPDIPTTYKRCLDRIPKSTAHLTSNVLRWVSFAKRPLTMFELVEAVSFSLQDNAWDPDRLHSDEAVIGSCANLIVLDKVDKCVRLTHPSVKQFLCQSTNLYAHDLALDPERADLDCGEECVNYLGFDDFQLQLQQKLQNNFLLPKADSFIRGLPFKNATNFLSGTVFRSSRNLQRALHVSRSIPQPSKLDNFALLGYAIEHWALHTKNISKESVVWEKFKSLSLQPNISWNIHPWTPSGRSAASHFHGLLVYAARERHLPLLRLLFESESTSTLKKICNLPSVQDGLCALHIAARLGFADVISILLKICDVNVRGPSLRTPLYYTVQKNHLEAARRLLDENNIEIESISEHKNSAFSMALTARKDGMAALLLEKQLRLGYSIQSLTDQFFEAVLQGYEAIVKLLLERGFPVDCMNNGKTALMVAAEWGKEKILSLLLKYPNTNVNLKSSAGNTALSEAARRGHRIIVERLLSHMDIDVNSTNQLGETALAQAVRYGHHEAVGLLLERKDIDINVKDGDGNPILVQIVKQYHSLDPHSSLWKLLGRKDLDVNSKDNNGKTALAWATLRLDENAVQRLLRRADVDVNSEDSQGRTALKYATTFGLHLSSSSHIVPLLLAYQNSRRQCTRH